MAARRFAHLAGELAAVGAKADNLEAEFIGCDARGGGERIVLFRRIADQPGGRVLVVAEGPRREVQALQSIDLDIQPNEFVTFVGASGCGKSTLLRIVAGLETQTTGQVVIGGNGDSIFKRLMQAIGREARSAATVLATALSAQKNMALAAAADLLGKAPKTLAGWRSTHEPIPWRRGAGGRDSSIRRSKPGYQFRLDRGGAGGL